MSQPLKPAKETKAEAPVQSGETELTDDQLKSVSGGFLGFLLNAPAKPKTSGSSIKLPDISGEACDAK